MMLNVEAAGTISSNSNLDSETGFEVRLRALSTAERGHHARIRPLAEIELWRDRRARMFVGQ
jgi:hypothetical protein